MGIVADLPKSNLSFQKPTIPVSTDPLFKSFLCTMQAFEINFAFKFDSDPKKGVGGSPFAYENWTIGIVQNVIYQMTNFEYDDGSVFKRELKDTWVDSLATIYSGFYSDPVFKDACRMDPDLPCGTTWVRVSRPVVDIYYTSKGYGEILDPWNPGGVEISNKPNSLDMWDQPMFGARLKLKNGALLSRAEDVVAFQVWLVAKTPTATHVLAHFPAFSLVFWTEPLPLQDPFRSSASLRLIMSPFMSRRG